MISRDLRSQLDLRAAADRFRDSAPERELVKMQLDLGLSPVAIERADRVERRLENLGFDGEQAAALASEVKAAPGPFEARAVARRRSPGLERIIGRDDLVSSTFLERGAAAASSVCCVRLDGTRIGTGFLVGPRLLMTNAHVIPSRDEAASCTAEFDFEDARDGGGVDPSVVFRLAPEEFFVASPEDDLDYALVAVKAKSGARELKGFGFLRLDPAVGKVLRGEPLNIIQHPDGAPKRVALRQNRFTALLERFMHYETDTMPGSSGSPVFNDQWQVVCLHHSGVPLTDARGNILTRDNRVWDGDRDDPELIRWIGNEGVRISRIVEDVAVRAGATRPKILAGFPEPASNPSNDEERLVDGDPDRGDRDSTGYRRTPTTGRRPPEPAPASPPGHGGQTSIRIPLTLTLSVDPAGLPLAISVAGPDGADGPGPAGPRRDRPAQADPDAVEPGSLVERGLRNLERSRTRQYYDEDRDERDRDEYYDGIRADRGTLFEDLGRLVSDTHTTRLAYKVARIEHLYAWVDLQREKDLRSVYSDERFDPSNFIREDFVLERRLERLIEKRRSRESGLDGTALERMIAALEAQEPFNCEHVVPQSWFDNKAPMQGDLHHLFACQSQCNSFRGNRPYHDFGKFAVAREAANRPRCGFSDEGLFEPFLGKGKVARATLYFLVRYPGRFEDMYEELEDGVGTLLDWHERSPVTEHERHRNQAIRDVQGNRNPFIDRPEWAAVAFGG